ncbi:REP element-mobilizing transposase RayT, partial [Lachnospiraceae bacterium PF1-22]|uniref:hypothetical protein n=1 Tax=Ohessyouella blattaphilus TaxID=2949333 RepID=UPI003E2AE84F
QTYEFVKVQNRSYFRRFTAVRDCWNLIFHLSLVFSSSISSCSGYNILELNGEADHLHLLFEATPGMA